MRGKYKRKKQNKYIKKHLKLYKNKKIKEIINKYRNDTVLYCEEILGVKLLWYQKLLLRNIDKLDKSGFYKGEMI